MAGVLAKRCRRAGAAEGGAELLGLDRGPLCEVGSGDAGRKAQVVLDPRAGPRLATDGDHLDDDRAQSLRRAVHRRREPGRTSAHHDQVEATVRQLSDRQPEVVGQNARRRAAQDGARGDHDRQVAWGDIEFPQKALDVGVGVRVQPLVRDATASQELPNAAGVR